MLIFSFSCKKEQKYVDDLYLSYVGKYTWVYSTQQNGQYLYYDYPQDSSSYSFQLYKNKTLSIIADGIITQENTPIEYINISEDRLYFKFRVNDSLFSCGLNVESNENYRKDGRYDLFQHSGSGVFFSYFEKQE